MTSASAGAWSGSCAKLEEEQLRLTIDEAPIGMALVALDGPFVHVNRALSEIVGYPPEELVRLTSPDITHPNDVEEDVALAGQLARGEIPPMHGRETVNIPKDGSVVDIQLSVSIVRGQHGAPSYYIAQVEDVTQRKRAEAALKESEQRLTWHWKRRRWASGTRIYHQHHRALEKARRDIRIFSPGRRLEPRHSIESRRSRRPRPRQETLRSGLRLRCLRDAVPALRKDGSIHWISSQGRVYRNTQGVPIRMLGTIMDITERKGAEEALRRSEAQFRGLIRTYRTACSSTRAGGSRTQIGARGLARL